MTEATLDVAPPLPAAAALATTDAPAEPRPVLSLYATTIAARPSRRHLWVLLAITLLGGLLRFALPSRPLLWGDDAYTVYRTHADYQAMLDILQYDGFTPLHYELYWLLGRAAGTQTSPMTAGGTPITHSVGLTPAVLRMLPALWGTLMVPAMYLLAVHLVRRRTALVVALVTACSAYLLGYSRDMKMYMMCWCFSAYSAGCLLWWFRTRTRIAWLAWVAASLAMSSSHMTGMALLPFEAIFFLTRSKVDWRQSIAFVIGLAIIITPPAAYITQFNRWAQEEVEDFGFEVEGLGWVSLYNQGRDGPDLVRYATSAYLLSWEWPRASDESKIRPWILAGLKTTATLLLVLAAVGTMPWSRRLRGIRDDDVSIPQPWWRTLLWLGLWLVVPTYFMYCRSVPDFVTPRAWLDALGSLLGGHAWRGPDGATRTGFWVVLLLAATACGALAFAFPRFRRYLIWGFPLVAAAAFVVALLRTGVQPEPAARSATWLETLCRPLAVWADWISEPVILTALAVILPGLVVYYCAPTALRRLARAAQFALVAAALLGCCWLVYDIVHGKFEKEIAQAMTARGLSADAARSFVAQRAWQSIFMPRYVGFVWIAFSIALCAMLMRLPTRGLRFAAVTLLVGVNLTQFGGRLLAGTEPPLDRVASEVWQYDDRHNPHPDVSGRVYVNDIYPDLRGSRRAGHPGFGTLSGQQGKYYLGLARGYWIHPTEWRQDTSAFFHIYSGLNGPSGRRGSPSASPSLDYHSIAADVRRSSQLKRVIVWEKNFAEEDGAAPKPPTTDHLLPLLGPEWRKVSDEDYNVRFHWNWADLYLYRRSEYARQ